MIGLGGLDHARANSLNSAWHNLTFRRFADYMQTAQFQNALAKLIKLAQSKLSEDVSHEQLQKNIGILFIRRRILPRCK